MTVSILLLGAALAAPAPAGDFRPALRAVAVGVPGDDPAAGDTLEFAARAGFNAAWIDVGAGSPAALDPLCVLASRLGLVVIAEVRPLATPGFSFARDADVKRVRETVRAVSRRDCVDHVVLSFRGGSAVHVELRDAVRFGRDAVPAQIELARRVRRHARGAARFWFFPSGEVPLLDRLPRKVGLAWSGGGAPARTLAAADVDRVAAAAGGRPLLLFDAYPSGGAPVPDATTAPLAPLRGREAAVRRRLAGYAADASGLGAVAVLPLATVADWLRDDAYDPAASLRDAASALAGADEDARRALAVQADEWGGWVGEPDYAPLAAASPEEMAARLEDPSFAASLTWVARRYPERMASLRALAGRGFRDELLRRMERRYRIARVAPLCLEFLSRARAGREDAAAVLRDIEAERGLARAAGGDAHRALDRFLRAAAIPLGEDGSIGDGGGPPR